MQCLSVVDDGLTDGSASLVEAFTDDRVRLCRQPRNLGKGAAIRRGLGAATAPFVLIYDEGKKIGWRTASVRCGASAATTCLAAPDPLRSEGRRTSPAPMPS